MIEANTISANLSWKDLWIHFLIRLNIGRDQRKVETGVYSLGKPDENSPMFVSANYLMSFNKLRQVLKNMDAWILVLDTKGINVWCAAGKGTFGTQELIDKIRSHKIGNLLKHKTIILPQLGASGVSAHQVTKETGLKVIYGPVRAGDIPKFMANGQKASAEMRKVTFTFWERMVLVPVEISFTLKYILAGFLFFYIFCGISLKSLRFDITKAINSGTVINCGILISILSGLVLTPALLTLIPCRSFSFKGLALGVISTFCYIFILSRFGISGIVNYIGMVLLYPAISALLALNFTGSTTFTSPSGVRKELSSYFRPLLITALTGFLLICINSLLG